MVFQLSFGKCYYCDPYCVSLLTDSYDHVLEKCNISIPIIINQYERVVEIGVEKEYTYYHSILLPADQGSCS